MQELTDAQFLEALKGEDALGLVIRAHLHIEHWIDKFLGLQLPKYTKYAKDLNADYEAKVLLSCMAGLSPDMKAPLTSFGKLRNRFAHRPNYVLTEGDAGNIYKSLSAKHKEQLQVAYSQLAQQFKREVKSYAKLDAEAKINLLAVLLRAKLKKACVQASGT